MKFIIGSQFSREFTFQESSVTSRLSKELNEHFEIRNYGSGLNKIIMGVICVSKGFEPFFKVRSPNYIAKDSALEYEIKLDFEKMFRSNENREKKC